MRLEAEGLPVTEFFTSSVPRIVPAWQSFYDAVMEGSLSHSGDPALARHVDNLVLKVDRHGSRPTRDRSSPRSFIDLGIAAVISFTRARSRATEPQPRQYSAASFW